MSRYKSGEAIYKVADRFVDAALRHDDSLFTPGRAIWSLTWLEELDRRYVQNPELGSDSFEQKLAGQLNGASPQAYQLMAEVLFVYYLPSGWNVVGETKRRKIQEVLGWSPEPVQLPAELSAILDSGIGSGGPGFHLYKWASLSYLISFVRRFKQLPGEERVRLLGDPWAFQELAAQVPSDGGGIYGRESLLHIVFPDTFERVFSGQEKLRLVNEFSVLADDPTAIIDRRIASIRAHLAERFGPDFDFYETDGVRALWKKFDDPWVGFIYWAARFHERPSYRSDELDYKLEIVRRLTAAREAVRTNGDWQALLKHAFAAPNNLTNWQMHDKFVRWCQVDPSAARELLRGLWEGTGDNFARLGVFEAGLPISVVSGRGSRANLGSFLLMVLDPYQYPPYRVSAYHTGYHLTKFDPGDEQDEVAMYRAGMEFLDRLMERAGQRGLQMSDRLDAQSVVWCVYNYPAPDDWSPEDRVAFEKYKRGSPDEELDVEEQEETEVDVEGAPTEAVSPPDPLARLADELLLDLGALEEIADLLKRKHQVVFYGPPGTGKTYVARKLAQALAGDAGRVRIVQFHPSYAYEDFVEGFRPRLKGDAPGFELVPGPLRVLAARASEDPGHDYFLIIDELNRGNLAKVFGELYFLLEYRDEPLVLQYSADAFRLPRNVYFIGTMNTADRSIALLDAALRRRFAFVPFFPDRPPIQGLLRRWLQQNRSGMAWVADVVDLANRKLADRNGAIGPSFFMQSDLDAARLDRTWQHEILPYLEDCFFDMPERLGEFGLTGLRKEAAGSSVPPSAELGTGEGATLTPVATGPFETAPVDPSAIASSPTSVLDPSGDGHADAS